MARTRRTSALVAAVTAAVWLIAIVSSAPAQVPGGSYSGSAESGGTVVVDVSENGKMAVIEAFDVATSCGPTPTDPQGHFVAISPTGLFQDALPAFPAAYGLRYQGQFAGPDQAAGWLRWSTYYYPPFPCNSQPVSWSVTRDTDPLHDPSQSKALKKCKKIKSKAKRKRCVARAKKKGA